MTKQRLCILDGSSLLYRSFFGVRPLHTSKGQPTHAIYGFCRTLKKISDELEPSHLVVVWDTKGGSFRNELYSAYKATRQAPPSDLLEQKEFIQKFLDLIAVKQLEKKGFEADDIINTICDFPTTQEKIVVTGDKDLHQLLREGVCIFDPFKQKMITKESFISERGFNPQNLLLYHSLLGDSSDNIPGVKGVGEKTAEKLTVAYGNLDNLYDHLSEVSPESVRLKLLSNRDNAYLSMALFTLGHTGDIFNVEESYYDKEKWKYSEGFFKDLEIKPFMPAGVDFPDLIETKKTNIHQNSLFHVVNTPEQLKALIMLMEKAKVIAIDTETDGLRPFHDALVGISISIEESSGYYIPLQHEDIFPQLSLSFVLQQLKPLLEERTVKKTFHNAKFDISFFYQYGVDVQGVVFDSLLAADLLRVGSEKIGLKALSSRYLGEEMILFEEVLKKYKTFSKIPVEEAFTYAAHDAVQTYKLYEIFSSKIEENKELKKLFYEVELPLNRVLFEMERQGICLDERRLADLCEVVREKLQLIITKIGICLRECALDIDPSEINFNSPQQLEIVLFDQLQLPVVKKSKTGKRSTEHEVLVELSSKHPVPGLIIQYRELSKLLNTYLQPLPLEVNPKTRKIHTTYSQTIAATGRLSSSQPNLQNIPIGGEFGLLVRSAFVAEEGTVFISADYSQIELRILAHVSGDPVLCEAFRQNKDIHRETAAQIFNVHEQFVSDAQRQIGKKINFSIMYGLTPYGLSKDLGISPSVAKGYIENYFERYAGVRLWMDSLIEDAKKNGYVRTMLGRRRYVPGLHEKNRTVFEAERRVAINTPIQGTASDLLKLAMLDIHKKLEQGGFNSKLILQIHDELLLQAPIGEVEIVSQLVAEAMKSVVSWAIPLDVTVRTGSDWGAASK